MRNKSIEVAAVGALMIAALMMTEARAASVASGYDQDAALKAGVRYRHMNGNGKGMPRVYLGTLPFATNGPTNISWGSGKHVTLRYDANSKELTTVVGTLGASPVTVTRAVGDLGELNYLYINVQAHHPMGSTSVELKNVTLNGAALMPANFSGTESGAKWNVTGENLSNGFVLEGDIALSGMQPGMDHNHVEIDLGYSDQTGPKVIGVGASPNPAILNGTTTLRATVSDADAGNHTVVNAEYSLNGGDWTAMSPQDGAFDAVSEDVEAELPANQLGGNEVCVRGTDAKGNVTTPPTCTTFLVTYQFEGFTQPIDSTLVNTAKAGQAVPGKWRLTDAHGVAIDNPGSFTGLYSYPVNCESFAGEPGDAVEEYSAGDSGLQYNGDGNWQFNWKTPKSYAGSCQAMYVEFDSGAISPIVIFKFK